MKDLIGKTTEAAVSEIVVIKPGKHTRLPEFPDGLYLIGPITLYLIGDVSDDVVVHLDYYDGYEWQDTQQTLTTAFPMLTLYGPINFRVRKEDTGEVELGVGILYTPRVSSCR